MSFKRTPATFKQQLTIAIALSVILSGVELFNILTGRSLVAFGIMPRNADTLVGIALAPLLHGNVAHLISNLVPLCLFAFLVLQHGLVRFWLVTVWVIAAGGALVWCFGREAMHVGASGLVYGYFGFLIVAGIVSREIKLLIIAAGVAVVYGGLAWGVLPIVWFISWESHFFGLMAGAMAGYWWGRST